jgi:hypothetical protein
MPASPYAVPPVPIKRSPQGFRHLVLLRDEPHAGVRYGEVASDTSVACDTPLRAGCILERTYPAIEWSVWEAGKVAQAGPAMSGSLKLTRRIMPPANGVSQAESSANSRVWASGLEGQGRGREILPSNSMCRIFPRKLKRNRLSPRLLHPRGVVNRM